jgi:hypothetical protein
MSFDFTAVQEDADIATINPSLAMRRLGRFVR